MVWAIGTKPPAPIPCSMRKAMSDIMLQAKPQSTEATRKRPIAVRRTRFLP